MEVRASMDIWLRRIPVPTMVNDPERITHSRMSVRQSRLPGEAAQSRANDTAIAVSPVAGPPRPEKLSALTAVCDSTVRLDGCKQTVYRADRRFGRLLRENRLANLHRVSALEN